MVANTNDPQPQNGGTVYVVYTLGKAHGVVWRERVDAREATSVAQKLSEMAQFIRTAPTPLMAAAVLAGFIFGAAPELNMELAPPEQDSDADTASPE